MNNDLEKDARFWDRAARKYAQDPIADMGGYERTLEAVRQRLTPKDTVIEIGCGTGSTALRLAASVGHYIGTDLSSEMIAIAREKATTEAVPNLSFEIGEPDSYAWPQDGCDAVLAFNVLHLVPDPAQTLSAIYAHLKPGGLFISKTPCLALMNPLIRGLIPILQLFGKAPSVTVFTEGDLDRLLQSAGFEIVERDWHGTKGKDVRPYFVARKP